MSPCKTCFFLQMILFSGFSSVCGQNCSNFHMREETNYCNAGASNASCYVNGALNYRSTQSNYLPLWVELCLFQVPKTFETYWNDYNCHVKLDAGPVKCKLMKDRFSNKAVLSFESNCTLIFLWQNQIHFPSERITELVFGRWEKSKLFKIK